jgi:hypothetical protein
VLELARSRKRIESEVVQLTKLLGYPAARRAGDEPGNRAASGDGFHYLAIDL